MTFNIVNLEVALLWLIVLRQTIVTPSMAGAYILNSLSGARLGLFLKGSAAVQWCL